MKNIKIFVAGHRGMVGSALVRQLIALGYKNIITKNRSELDLTNQDSVEDFFRKEKPKQVYLAAARVGGIFANNTYPAEFIYQNLMIEANVVHSAYKNEVERILFLGSSCIYPKETSQPMGEQSLLTGLLEPTNEPYAVAKIAGIKLCESYNRQYGCDFRSVMPTNLYGVGDNYHPENSHVIPALIRRFHEAKINDCKNVVIWGTGNPKREFLYVDDMANACIHIMSLSKKTYSDNTRPMTSHINVGFGKDITIRELAICVKKVVGFKGDIVFDQSKLDGVSRKLLDITLIRKLGWKPKTELIDGLKASYIDFIENI